MKIHELCYGYGGASDQSEEFFSGDGEFEWIISAAFVMYRVSHVCYSTDCRCCMGCFPISVDNSSANPTVSTMSVLVNIWREG